MRKCCENRQLIYQIRKEIYESYVEYGYRMNFKEFQKYRETKVLTSIVSWVPKKILLGVMSRIRIKNLGEDGGLQLSTYKLMPHHEDKLLCS